MKIAIDAGHGGHDSGASSKTCTKEKDINISVARGLQKILAGIPGVEVFMTREDDSFLSIAKRCDLINEFGADVCISVHHNGGNGKGYECIHTIHHGTGEALAKVIAERFKELGQNAHWKGVYSKESDLSPGQDYYGMIRGTHCPTVIVEYAFMDTEDFTKIDTYEEQMAEARAISLGVTTYYNIVQTKSHWASEYRDRLEHMGMYVGDDYDTTLTKGMLYAALCKFIDATKGE